MSHSFVAASVVLFVWSSPLRSKTKATISLTAHYAAVTVGFTAGWSALRRRWTRDCSQALSGLFLNQPQHKHCHKRRAQLQATKITLPIDRFWSTLNADQILAETLDSRGV